MDLGQNLQHLHLIGQRSSPAPQELVVQRITIGHLAVVQVLLLHQIFGDEPSGLPKVPVPPPSIDPQLTEEFSDFLPSGEFTLHEDNAQEHYEETGLGQIPTHHSDLHRC